MAGIGFELKKLFNNKGILATVRAYGYTVIVCTGPMLLGIILLLCMRLLAVWGDALRQDQDLLIVMITYTLLASIVFNNAISMVTTRYSADMLYSDKPENVLPSLFGSTAVMLVVGGILYGAFLLVSGIAWLYRILCLILFCELIIVWSQINYVAVLKDYRRIFLVFLAGTASAFISGAALVVIGLETVIALMAAVCTGYGVMMIGYFYVLLKSLPFEKGNPFDFIDWMGKFPSLAFIGFFSSIGLFSHLVIVWFSPLGIQVKGLFYGAPLYDIPALIAFITTLFTTVSFITSTEVNFYPKYRRYFDLLNQSGTIADIELAEKDMLSVLRQELLYLTLKQFAVSLLAIAVSAAVLLSTNLGFSTSSLGTFRILCIGYGIYAPANSVMLILLYFSDNKGALAVTASFSGVSTLMTIVLLNGRLAYYGLGFILGAAAMYLVGVIRLLTYTGKLQYNVLSAQPLFRKERKSALSDKLTKLLGKTQNAKSADREAGYESKD